MNRMSHLEMAADRLHSMEQLLLHPTPEAIRACEACLQEAAVLVAEHGEALRRNPGGEGDCAIRIDSFCVLCDRVAKLLEGARRAQWIRMRLITSLTQTYTARAEAKNWRPPCGTVNVCM